MMDIAEYGIGEWDSEKWGNHRVLVEAKSDGAALRVKIPWRRWDDNPQDKGVFILSSASGNQVDNIIVLSMDRESAHFLFEPVDGAGIYEFYYMRYSGSTRAPYPKIEYCRPERRADSRWAANAPLKAAALPEASVLRIEACAPLYSMYPMAVIANKEERAVLDANPRPFLLFPEHRSRSIKMKKDVPVHWAKQGPFQTFVGEADRGEFYVFQIGVYAHARSLDDVTLAVCDLTNDRGHAIPAAGITCFNLGGIDCKGRPFNRQLNIPKGEVRVLWVGIDIPVERESGTYIGGFSVSARGTEAQDLNIRIYLTDFVVPARGDDDPRRLTRLRWLNSVLGSQGEPLAPYTAVGLSKNEFSILGRRIRIGAQGLPDAMESFFNPEVTGIGDDSCPILSAPMEFSIIDESGNLPDMKSSGANCRVDAQGNGLFSALSWGNGLELAVKGSLEPDGFVNYSCTLSTESPRELMNVALDVPLSVHVVKYRLGLGFKGGYFSDDFDWSWDVADKNQDSVWIGSERAGLQVSLRDKNYRRPLNTNFYKVQPLHSPESWDNNGAGSIRFHFDNSGNGRLICSSGQQTLKPNHPLHFDFRLLITPFRPLDTDKQWNNRFYHEYGDPGDILAQGANVINVHHAKPVNPFINYPFLRSTELKAYADEIHSLGMKLRLYYTVRELTNHAPEIFALRSLGDEIFSPGSGGGHSWLQEQFKEDYVAAWHVFDYGCVAVANSGESRWHNAYVEGVDWLARNMEIDGVYIDDLAFDRDTMKRVRRILDHRRPGALIDLHSANQFREDDGYANSINMYMEHLPYLDRIWFGEYFEYDAPPDYWMTEVAGIPFGTMGEMLQDGGHPWRGFLYGMTSRWPHAGGDPRSLWKLWDDFGISGSQMIGYWSPNCPVNTCRSDILATVYQRPDRTLAALGSWCKEDAEVVLSINWDAIGLTNSEAEITLPFVEGLQENSTVTADLTLLIPADKGAILLITRYGDEVSR